MSTGPDQAGEDRTVVHLAKRTADRVADRVAVRPTDDVAVPEEGELVAIDPPEQRKTIYATILGVRTADRRPVIPAYLRSRDELRDLTRWLGKYAGHTVAFHGVRLPGYALRLTVRSPRGLFRLATVLHGWVFDFAARPLRADAVRSNDQSTYMTLARHRDKRVRQRGTSLGLVLIGLAGLGTVVAFLAPVWVQAAGVTGLVALLGKIGSPSDRPVVRSAVLPSSAPARLTSDMVTRALQATGLAAMNKRDVVPLAYVAPIVRDGPGWRAEGDLPYGVTATDIMERRDRLASGLRRPLGCVWPEPVDDEHTGRLVLWVGDQPLSKMPAPSWPLLKRGSTSMFEPIPFAVDQRGRQVKLTLFEWNVLIGAMPGGGKTAAVRDLGLAAALDPYCQIDCFEHKGTGDLDALEGIATRYASGVDDASIAATLACLREVCEDLGRRAAVLQRLPKSLKPDNKVTPELARRPELGLHTRVVIIDECQNVFTHEKYGTEAAQLCTDIIKLGRAIGVILILATQRPDADSLPKAISANAGIRFCLRVTGQPENDMVLGTSMYKRGVNATLLTPQDKGVGYLAGVFDQPLVCRTYYVNAEQAEKVAERALQLRRDAGTLDTFAPATAAVDGPALLDDLVTALRADDWLWSEHFLERLTELRPAMYESWTVEAFAAAARGAGCETRQLNRTRDGERRNQRGLTRDQVLAAVRERDERRASGGR